MSATLHATLVFERKLAAPVEEVFAAFSDPLKRAEWGAPSETAALIYDAADFREGGQDKFRCGSKADPNIHGVTQYLDIVANTRIVSSETITVNGNRLCVSLTTLELAPDGNGTNLKNTTQLVSFIGQDMVNGFATGTNAALDNLVAHFR
jgi:uncharacterized protein YndB with AHSA1/START domain